MHDFRFEDFLFIHVVKINREGEEPSFHYSLMNSSGTIIHNWSADKNQFKHCYHQIQEGRYYIVQQTDYQLTPRKKRWVWEYCVEVPTKGMLSKAFDLWRKTHDIEAVLNDSGLKEYAKQKKKKGLEGWEL